MVVYDILKAQFFEQYELLLRLIIACVLGMLIGFERKNRNKMAGVRTHAVVAFGSALIMIVSKYGFEDIGSYDASRIASQIVSGTGFLGAGIIYLKDSTSISGLTTAAGIWATSGVGMCIGAGQYFIAVSSSILLIVLQVICHRIGFLSNEAYRAAVKMTIDCKVNIQELEEYIIGEQVEIRSVRIKRGDKADIKLEMELVFSPKYDKIDFLNRLAVYPGVISVCG